MDTMPPHQWLSTELTEKKTTNPRYSLRMMAKRIGLSPGRLSEFISGKRPITRKQAEKIADRLSFGFEKRNAFLSSVDFDVPSGSSSDAQFRKLSSDAFNVVAEWYHFAILSLMDLDDFKMSPIWIGQRLGISKKVAEAAIERLQSVGLIEKSGKVWVKREAQHTTTHDVPSAALRISHRQSLQQSINALDEVPVDLRDITSITMAVDLKTIPIVKNMIKVFRRKVAAAMETGDKTEVYNLNIQLIPVTTIENRKVPNEN